LLFEKGGWWADTDVVCLRPWSLAQDFVFATERNEDGSVLTATNVLRAAPKAPFLASCIAASEQVDKATLAWSEIGPYLVDRIVKERGLQSFAVTYEVFNPVDWFDVRCFLEPARSDWPVRTLGVHLWNEMWRHLGLDPERDARRDSLYASLRGTYL